MKHFTILEEETGGEYEIMIGTINNTTEDSQGKLTFATRLQRALEEHFDAMVRPPEIPDLFDGSGYWDFLVDVEDLDEEDRWLTYTIRIIETWIY